MNAVELVCSPWFDNLNHSSEFGSSYNLFSPRQLKTQTNLFYDKKFIMGNDNSTPLPPPPSDQLTYFTITFSGPEMGKITFSDVSFHPDTSEASRECVRL